MTDNNFTFYDLKKIVDVSHETFLKLENYIALLKKWQKTINLISNTTMGDIWERHIVDSAQLINHLEKTDRVIDVGSGAGFPGLVLAILGIEKITLVESDERKAAFLREAARTIGVNVTVMNKRVEEVALDAYDVMTARGFAPLREMLSAVGKNVSKSIKLLILKGKNYKEEIDKAHTEWAFNYEKFTSVTDSGGVIISITNISKTGG